jgi:hypothetical protein
MHNSPGRRHYRVALIFPILLMIDRGIWRLPSIRCAWAAVLPDYYLNGIGSLLNNVTQRSR